MVTLAGVLILLLLLSLNVLFDMFINHVSLGDSIHALPDIAYGVDKVLIVAQLITVLLVSLYMDRQMRKKKQQPSTSHPKGPETE